MAVDNLSSQWQHQRDIDAPESMDTTPFLMEVFPAVTLTATSKTANALFLFAVCKGREFSAKQEQSSTLRRKVNVTCELCNTLNKIYVPNLLMRSQAHVG